MRTYTIAHTTDRDYPYTIHLGTDLFYSSVAWAKTYKMAVAKAKALAGADGKVYYTEGLFEQATEI